MSQLTVRGPYSRTGILHRDDADGALAGAATVIAFIHRAHLPTKQQSRPDARWGYLPTPPAYTLATSIARPSTTSLLILTPRFTNA